MRAQNENRDENRDDVVPVITRLMTPAPQLQFELISPEADQSLTVNAMEISGWVAAADSQSRLVIETCGNQKVYSMAPPSPAVAQKFANAPSSLHVYEFTQRIHAEKPVLGGTVRVGVTMNGILYWLYAISAPKYTPRGILFGGSNSVTNGGVADGLKKHLPQIKNVAAGASSSLQNLFELLKCKNAILEYDFVITESNVNDSLVAHTLSNLSLVLKNIDWFYRELSLFDVPVYVLMLPLSRDGSAPESPEVVEAVNKCHRENAQRYGYHLVDVAERFAALKDNQLDLMMANERHPIQIFMYRLGENLARYLIENRQRLPATEPPAIGGLQHSVSLFDEQQKKKVHKSNARFDEWLYPLLAPTAIPSHYAGQQVVGIGTWPDEYASAILANRNTQVVKRFAPFVGFSEIVEPFFVDDATSLSPNQSLPDTETSIAIPPNTHVASAHATKIMGMLFREAGAEITYPVPRGAFPVPEVIPNVGPYFHTINYFVHKGRGATASEPRRAKRSLLSWRRKGSGPKK